MKWEHNEIIEALIIADESLSRFEYNAERKIILCVRR